MSLLITVGRRRLGKTTLNYSMSRRCTYRFIIDPRGQLDAPNAVRVRTPEELHATIEAFLIAIEEERIAGAGHVGFEILITPAKGQTQSLFDYTAICVEDFMGRQPHGTTTVLSIDEAQFFNLKDSQSFEYIVRASPPHAHVMVAAHRPADIPTDVRALSDTWLMFRTTQEHDLKVIGERCGPGVQRRVQLIEPRQFIEWDDGAAVAREHLDPRVWYVPLITATAPEERLLSGGTPTNVAKIAVDSELPFSAE